MTAPRYDVRLTRGAEQDIESIHDYFVAHGAAGAATALVDRLLERVAALETFPDRGAVPKELAALGIDTFRQIVEPPYRIFYRVIDDLVVIVLVVDGRRNMQALLERRLLHRE